MASRRPHFFRTAAAFWVFDRQERWSYPMAMINRVIGIATLIFLLYFAGETVETTVIDTREGGDIFLFTLSGYAVLQLLSSSLGVYAGRVRSSQLTGLLEACLMTRTPLWQVLAAMPAYNVSASLLRAAVLLGVGVALSGAVPSFAGAAGALVFAGLGLVAFLSLGMISGAITLVIKVGDPIARIVSMGSLLIAGTFFPRDVLPPILATLGGWFPISPVLDGLRGTLWGHQSLTELAGPLSILMGETIVLMILAAIVSRWAIRRVLADGSLSHY